MELAKGKKIYFASDFHLGYPTQDEARWREKLIVEWLDSIKNDAQELFLVGDIFDFWYEYKNVVPRGFIRFLGKLAELSDLGIKITILTGNHDIWIGDYLQKELNANIVKRKAIVIVINGKQFYIHHGHALGKYDKGMNLLTHIFENRFLQWCFSRIHPNSAIGFGLRWSRHNRKLKVFESSNFLGEEREWLLLYAKDVMKQQSVDYFVFGHRHVAMVKQFDEKTSFYNLGNWVTNTTYGVFDGEKMQILQFRKDLENSDKILMI